MILRYQSGVVEGNQVADSEWGMSLVVEFAHSNSHGFQHRGVASSSI